MTRPVVIILVLAVLAPAGIARGLNQSVDDGARGPASAVAEPAPAPAASVQPVVWQQHRRLARAQERRARATARRARPTARRHQTRQRPRTRRSAPVSTQRVAARPVQQQRPATRAPAAPTHDTGPAPTPPAPSKPTPHRAPASPQTGTGTFDDSG